MNQVLVPIKELKPGVFLDLYGDSELDPIRDNFVFYDSFAEVTKVYVPMPEDEDQRVELSIRTVVNELTYRLDPSHLVKVVDDATSHHDLSKHLHRPFDA